VNANFLAINNSGMFPLLLKSEGGVARLEPLERDPFRSILYPLVAAKAATQTAQLVRFRGNERRMNGLSDSTSIHHTLSRDSWATQHMRPRVPRAVQRGAQRSGAPQTRDPVACFCTGKKETGTVANAEPGMVPASRCTVALRFSCTASATRLRVTLLQKRVPPQLPRSRRYRACRWQGRMCTVPSTDSVPLPRWARRTAAGMREAKKSFQPLKGSKHLPSLKAALPAHQARHTSTNQLEGSRKAA
jgi:hypothetical protein